MLIGGCAELTGVVKKEAQTAGGAETTLVGPRQVNPADVALPPGYRIEAVSTRFTFPTAVVFDDANRPHVVESGYSYGERYAPGRLIRVESDGSHTVVAQGVNQPWTGGTFHRGAFYVAQGGYPGKIVRITPDGQQSIVIDGIPSKGDHHTNGPVIGPGGWLYFAQGAITNSGVVGEDNALFGWLLARPQLHDIPAQDIVLAGHDFRSGRSFRPFQ